MKAYEILGDLYLGKLMDLQTNSLSDQYYLYHSKDLTTHGVCVGMTGSGKTGLCISLLEELAIDNIPALIIDPKGDMSNLLLNFPDLKSEDFKPWINPEEAEAKKMTFDDYAAKVASDWKDGLADWDIEPDRIEMFKEKAEICLYTPGSKTGIPLALLEKLEKPVDAIRSNPDLLAEYISTSVSGLLTLIGIDADPITSREHILLSLILNRAWTENEDMDFSTLISNILQPGVEKVGVLDTESFYPEKDRRELAMRINNLLASPKTKAWFEGEALDIDRLLYTDDGRAKLSILSINHLSDDERMFFVSNFLNRLIAWMRLQPGTSSLRALLYMDEIYGYFPPVANPPSKKPLLTLLKQARAFGLGVLLTTQNPSDLDYKGLANIGTWFIGRLQTEQDKKRLLDGLVQVESGINSDEQKKAIDEIISSLPKRSFMVKNSHDEAIRIFQARWAMSYLAGPLTRPQIEQLTRDQKQEALDSQASPSKEEPVIPSQKDTQDETNKSESPTKSTVKPQETPPEVVGQGELKKQKVADGITEYFMKAQTSPTTYAPSIYAITTTNYENSKLKINTRSDKTYHVPIKNGLVKVDFSQAVNDPISDDDISPNPEKGSRYLNTDAPLDKKTTFNGWESDLKDYIYNNEVLTLYRDEVTGLVSDFEENKSDFVVRARQSLHEKRDEEMLKLKDSYQKKMDKQREKIRKQEQRLERESDQANRAKLNTMVNISTTLLDSFLGNKRFGKTTLNKAAGSARAANRSRQQQGDVDRALSSLEVYREELEELENKLKADLEDLKTKFGDDVKVEEVHVKAKKANINIKSFVLLWLPE